MKKGAIFDMDGLLFDTEQLYQDSWNVLAVEFGQTPVPDFAKAISGTNGEQMRKVVQTYYPSIDADEYIKRCLERVDRLEETHVPEKPGLHTILNGLKKNGVRMAVASSSPAHMIRRNLQVAGVESFFDVVVSSSQVEHGKPAPDIFLLAASQLGFEPEECYVFEDSFNGIRSGAAAGCAAVMIPDQVPPTEEIQSLCTGIYSNLAEAMDAIEKGNI